MDDPGRQRRDQSVADVKVKKREIAQESATPLADVFGSNKLWRKMFSSMVRVT